MRNLSRRSFIRYSGGLFVLSSSDMQNFSRSKKPLLSFSTLGCPDWTLDQIADFAAKHHYSGIEIRGLQRELDLSKSSAFNSDGAIRTTKNRLAEKKLKIVGLGSSAAMHHAAGPEREKAHDEAKKFIGIAEKTACPYVRVFPDKLPKDRDKTEVLKTISESLRILGDYAKGSGVSVLMETHGDLVHTNDLLTVMNNVGDHPNVALVWDISNMWSVTKEDPSMVYSSLKKWIRHTHLKDLRQVGGKDEYTLLGEGEVPVFKAVELLRNDNYKGYYSFEWEKMWHPEIAEPEVAFAQYSEKMQQYFSKK